jgi:hypothetical protein
MARTRGLPAVFGRAAGATPGATRRAGKPGRRDRVATTRAHRRRHGTTEIDHGERIGEIPRRRARCRWLATSDARKDVLRGAIPARWCLSSSFQLIRPTPSVDGGAPERMRPPPTAITIGQEWRRQRASRHATGRRTRLQPDRGGGGPPPAARCCQPVAPARRGVVRETRLVRGTAVQDHGRGAIPPVGGHT